MCKWNGPLAVIAALQLFVGCASADHSKDDVAAQPVDTTNIADTADSGAEQTSNKPPTIHGRWWLTYGKDKLALGFDTVNGLMTTAGIPPIPFLLDGDSITMFEKHDGELTTGRIWKLTNEELGVRWTTGDSNVYQR